MKKALALMLALTLMTGGSTACIGKEIQGSALKKAYQLFIPIACTNSEVFRFRIGTGFPVGKHWIMTARHVDCGDGVTEISSDGGHTWELVPPEHMLVHVKYDVRVYYIPDQTYKHEARFRNGVVGESTVGYGIAFGETSTFGFVMKSDARSITISNVAIGGMSGSAIVGKDGKVLGMTVLARPTIVGRGIPTSWASEGVPAMVLQALVKDLDKVKVDELQAPEPGEEQGAPHGAIQPVQPLPYSETPRPAEPNPNIQPPTSPLEGAEPNGSTVDPTNKPDDPNTPLQFQFYHQY